MKISELPFAATMLDSDYVFAVQNGESVRMNATTFKGEKGDAGPSGTVNTEPTDLTSSTSFYDLAVGETAYIDYTDATSVPLYINTSFGSYELRVYGDRTVSFGTSGPFYLSPNNAVQTSIIGSNHQVGVTSASNSAYQSATTRFELGSDILVFSSYEICTSTNSKTVTGWSVYQYNNNSYYRDFITYQWTDSVEWDLLGTITFPFEQSGKIVIKRII